jgi:hypothetical protein
MAMTGLMLLSLCASANSADAVKVPEPKPVALVQSWVTLHDQDLDPLTDPAGYGDPEDDTGFKLRRVRLGLEGADKTLSYGVVVGVTSPYDGVEASEAPSHSVQLVDAYGGFSPMKDLWFVGGIQKVPVSREALIGSGDLAFTDRSVSTHYLAPGRDLGATIDYSYSIARLRVGAFNGSGDMFGDDEKGKLLSARAEVTIGDGNAYETWGQVNGLTLGVAVDGFQNADQATKTMGAGADAIVRMGGLAVLIEGRMKKVEPKEELVVVPGVLGETSMNGAMVQVGYSVGPVEPVIRYAVFDDDTDFEDVGDVSEGLAGVTLHAAEDRIRAGAGYVLRLEKGDMPVPNNTIRAWFQVRL